MSARALSWAWQQRPRTRTEKLVLTALADRADDDGECFPSLSWLAEKCAPISERTVKRATAGLAEQGLLAKVERRRRGGSQQFSSWLYRLPLDESQGPSVSSGLAVEPGAIAVAPQRRKAKTERTTEVVLYSPTVWTFVDEIEGQAHPRYLNARGRIVEELKIALRADGTLEGEWVAELRRRHRALAREYGESKATARTLVQSWAKAGRWADKPPAASNGNGRGPAADVIAGGYRERLGLG